MKSGEQKEYGVNLSAEEIAEVRSFIARRQNFDEYADVDVLGRIHQKLGDALDDEPEPHWDVKALVKRFDKMVTIFSNEYYNGGEKTGEEDEILQAIHAEIDNWKEELGFPTPTISLGNGDQGEVE